MRIAMNLAIIGLASVLVGCEPSPHDLAGGKPDLERLAARVEANPDVVDARNSMDKTPLHYAVTYSRPETVKRLIEWGADVNAKDVTGMTPLHVAGTLNRVEEARILLANGANLEQKDEFGDTPLHSAAIHEKIDILNFFLEQGADPTATNKDGETPLNLARENRNPNAVKRLENVTGE